MTSREPFTIHQLAELAGARHGDGAVAVPVTKTPALTVAPSPYGNGASLTISDTTHGWEPRRYQTNPVPFPDTQITSSAHPRSDALTDGHPDAHHPPATPYSRLPLRYQTNPIPISDIRVNTSITLPSGILPDWQQVDPHEESRTLFRPRTSELPNEP